MEITVGCKCGWTTDIESTSNTNPSCCPECGGTIYLSVGDELSDQKFHPYIEWNDDGFDAQWEIDREMDAEEDI